MEEIKLDGEKNIEIAGAGLLFIYDDNSFPLRPGWELLIFTAEIQIKQRRTVVGFQRAAFQEHSNGILPAHLLEMGKAGGKKFTKRFFIVFEDTLSCIKQLMNGNWF